MTAPLSHFVLVPIWSWKSYRRRLIDAIEQHGAPQATHGVILDVVTRTRLWPREQLEVARELACHFRDAEAEGASAGEAIDAFGPPKLAAKLIRRAKRRQRGPVWKTWYAATRGLALVILLMVVAIAWRTSRIFLIEPTISVDAVAEFNAAQPSIPVHARGYPHLLDAIASFRPPSPELVRSFGFESGQPPENIMYGGEPVRWLDLEPSHTAWPIAAAHIGTLTDTLAALRKLAESQGIGYEYRLGFDPAYVEAKVAAGADADAFRALMAPSDWEKLFEGSVMSILLPHLGDLREFALLLTLAADAEREAGRPEAAAAYLGDAAAIAGHMLGSGTIIEQLVGIAIARRAIDRCHRLLDGSSAELDSEALTMLAHRFGGIGGAPGTRWRMDITGERIAGVDTLQRVFSDNGRGGGHLTDEGISFLNGVGSINTGNTPVDLREAATLSKAALLADRRSAREFLERGHALAEQANGRPLADFQSGSAASPLHVFLEETRTDPDGLLAGLMVPALENAFERAVVAGGHRDALLVRIAANLHERDTGRPPDSIEALVPRWMPAVPLDPWIDAPMRLKVVDGRLVVYSVGGDLDDDGGRPPTDLDATQQQACERDRWPTDAQGVPVDGDMVLWPTRMQEGDR